MSGSGLCAVNIMNISQDEVWRKWVEVTFLVGRRSVCGFFSFPSLLFQSTALPNWKI